jgi:NAD(P)-dependent dehydrogenase (short-subunit alcohol dehydrogenase family)
MPMEDLRRSVEVDFFGQIALTQPMVPLLRKARGRIVFIGSIADRTTVPFFGALAASKSAIAAASDTLRQELAPWGIHVALVEPGFISTGADETTKAMIDRVIEDFDPEAGRLYGEMFAEATRRGYRTQTSGSPPEGVAEVILEALTGKRPKAHYLTGSKAHLVANMARLPDKAQDELRRKAFGLPEPGSLASDEDEAD